MKLNNTEGAPLKGAPSLFKKEIHLYLINMNCSYGDIIGHRADITSAEREYAESFKFEKSQNNFVIARSALRNILSGYAERPPCEISFEYGRMGKPYLQQTENKKNIQFNSTGSGDMTVIGISLEDEIGVDVEKIRLLPNIPGLIETTFTPLEQQEFRRYSTVVNQAELYMRYWTHKEAFLKATGEGLSHPLQGIEFQYEREGLSLFSVDNDKSIRGKWEMYYTRIEGYSLCVAAPRENKNFSLYRWNY
ncbi:MAG: 4'-phosphopantetheinyl transferase superfamily protein [Spirochaetaceae bacterium]|nr:4'-phosphopantetheinyl transferase superfamily protein [Spirochaetaceae bacterium]